MDYTINEGPQTRIAPKHKEISPNNIPKKKIEPPPQFWEMREEELLAVMCATLRMKYDPLLYRTDQRYRAKADSMLFTGMIAMMTHYLRGKGLDVNKLVGENSGLIKTV